MSHRSTRAIDYQDVPRPMSALSDEYGPGHIDPPHSHRRGQLIYAIRGIMSVAINGGGFIVPPQRALWLPGGVEHEVACRGVVSLRTLYVDSEMSRRLPTKPQVLAISPLLRELIVEAMRVPLEYDVDGRDGRLMSLIIDEIEAMPTVPLFIPLPKDKQLAQVCRLILEDSSDGRALSSWAQQAGMSRRTFTRLFRRETGLSFAEWRQHVRLLDALSRLAAGCPVTTVAFDVGYNSTSAFSAMFRRAFGVTPTDFIGR